MRNGRIRGRHGDAIVIEEREVGVEGKFYATPVYLGDVSSDIDVRREI